jgi:hypothetical protein
MSERSPAGALAPPPNAGDLDAVEVLRVWASPDDAQQVALQTTWEEPGVWGLLLADVARHAAKAYALEGKQEADAFNRILMFFEAEVARPTAETKRL